MKKIKKILKKMVCMILVSTMFVAIMPNPVIEIRVEAASAANKKAINSYKKILQKTKINWSESTYGKEVYKTKFLEFSCIDINKDGVKELLLYNPQSDHAIGWYSIYSYVNGKAKQIYLSGGELTFYPGRGLVKEVNIYPGSYNESYLSMDSNGKMYCRFSRAGVTDSATLDLIRQSNTKYYTEYVSKDSPVYFYSFKSNGKEVTYQEYKKVRKKSMKKSKKKKITYYSNTSENRKKYLK